MPYESFSGCTRVPAESVERISEDTDPERSLDEETVGPDDRPAWGDFDDGYEWTVP